MRRYLLAALLLSSILGCRREPVPVPAKKEPAVKKTAARKEPATDRERFQGAWRAYVVEANGRHTGINAIWKFKGTQAILQEGFATLSTSKGTFAIDPSATPKTLDLEMDNGKFACIYDFTNDDLRVCMREAGKTAASRRPSNFHSMNDQLLFQFKRIED